MSASQDDDASLPECASDLFGTQYPYDQRPNHYNWCTEMDEEKTRSAREDDSGTREDGKEEDRSHSSRFFNHGEQTGYHGFNEEDRNFFNEDEYKPDTFLQALERCREDAENHE